MESHNWRQETEKAKQRKAKQSKEKQSKGRRKEPKKERGLLMEKMPRILLGPELHLQESRKMCGVQTLETQSWSDTEP